MQCKSLYRDHLGFIIVSFVFLLLYCDISFVNHYCYRTYALDLGIYNHYSWEYLHLRMPDTSMFSINKNISLSDHFDLYLIIFSPLLMIFGTYTLLVVQIISIVFGGLGIYKFFKLFTQNNILILLLLASFYGFFGIFSALAFDYHSNVVATMFIPWIFYFLQKKKIGYVFLMAFLACIGKENISLLIFFIFLGLMWDYRKDKKTLYWLGIFSIFFIAYFIVVVMVIMPNLTKNNTYHVVNNYCDIAPDFKQMILFMLQNPIESIKILFINHTPYPKYDFIKLESYICLLASGVVFLFFKPNYLLMLLPIFFQKMYSHNPYFWSISYQYNIEFAPILVIGTFFVINKISKIKSQNIIGIISLLFCISATIYSLDLPLIYRDSANHRFYQSRHYHCIYNIKKLNKLIKDIPNNASISATSSFTPHLAMREYIYSYPRGKDNVEVLLLSKISDSYPMKNEEILKDISKLKNQVEYKIIYEDEEVILFQKK